MTTKLVEATIRDQKMVALCTEKTTVGDFTSDVLNEFTAVFPRARPTKIKCVRDDQGRILSTRLLVFSIDDDEESSAFEDDLNPDDTFELYHKWQAYCAKQGQKYLIDISKLGKVPEPHPSVLSIIEEMRVSKDILVLNIVLGSLETLLREFKAYSAITRFAENNTKFILRNSKCFEGVVGAIKLLRYFTSFIDKNNYSKDLEAALNRFPDHQSAILKVFEELGGQNMINKINRRVEEQREKMGDLSSPYSPHEQILGPDNEQVDGDNDFGQDFFDQQQSFHADNIKTQPLTSSKDRVFEREILDDTIESAIESTNAIAAGGMTWERLRGLLESDDPRCRRFALQKASRALAAATLSEPQATANELDIDSVLAGHYSRNSPKNDKPRDHLLRINTIGEADDLVLSLLKCLKKSIHVPKRDQNDLRFSQELNSELSKSSLSSPRYLDQPVASMLINGALKSSLTDIEGVQGSLVCLDRIAMEWPSQTFRAIMKGYSRLLMTLAHAGTEFQSFVDIASSLVLLLIENVGWEEADIKLEDSALAAFLDQSEYCTTVYIALSYLMYKSKSSSEVHMSSSKVKSNGRGRSLSGSDEVKNSFEGLIQNGNFAVLKGLWKWSMNLNRKAKILALELLSGVSMQDNVRSFLVKFEGVSKLLNLLVTTNDNRAVSAGGDADGIDLPAVRFIVKTIVNICSTSEKAKQLIKIKLRDLPMGNNNTFMSELAQRDESIRFYFGMLH